MLPFTATEVTKNDIDKAYARLSMSYEKSIASHIWTVTRSSSNHGMGPTTPTTLPDPVVGNVLYSADVAVSSSSVDVSIPDDAWLFVGSGYIDLRPLDKITAVGGIREFVVNTVSHNNPLLTVCELDEYGQAGSRS